LGKVLKSPVKADGIKGIKGGEKNYGMGFNSGGGQSEQRKKKKITTGSSSGKRVTQTTKGVDLGKRSHPPNTRKGKKKLRDDIKQKEKKKKQHQQGKVKTRSNFWGEDTIRGT